jgi:hypothetical protein
MPKLQVGQVSQQEQESHDAPQLTKSEVQPVLASPRADKLIK